MKKLKLLIVDDIFTNRLLLSEILDELGHDHAEAENGKIAIEIIMENDFDLVLMDIEMPVINGIESTIYIKNKLPFPKNKIPVVALTAHNPSMFFEDYSDVGFDQLLTKPYSIDKIMNVIDAFCKAKA